MLKKIIFFFLFLSILFLSWKFFSRPRFEGEGANIRQALWEWQSADSEEEKYDAAQKASFFQLVRDLAKEKNEPFLTLSPEDELSLKEASNFLKEIMNKVQLLENSFSTEDINEITRSNPESIFRKLGRFETQSLKMENCTYEEYQELIKTKNYSAQELFENGGAVSAIVELREKKFFESYIENLIELIKNDPNRNERYGDLSKLYYPKLIKPNKFVDQTLGNRSSHEEYLQQFRNDLIKNGVDELTIDDYATGLALKSPKCLSSPNFVFVKHALRGLYEEVGARLLDFIKEEAFKSKTLPESIDDVKFDVGEHVYGFYLKKVSDNSIELRSPGKDTDENTEDDLSHGFVTLD
jgi:hypothetical protein